MTALWLEPAPRPTRPTASPDLRLVGRAPAGTTHGVDSAELEEVDDPRLVGTPQPGIRSDRRRRPSVAVRRRRTLLAGMALLVVGLALPLSGTGGDSHATGSAPAETGHPATYTVRPGDTLWTIAERLDPNGDPRPLVARMAAETGSENVVPGEHVVVP